MESAGEQAKCMTNVKSSLPAHAVQVQGKEKSRQPYRNARSGSSASHSTASYTPVTNSRSCFHCGSDKHLANAMECPTIKTCKTCNKKGHFARVCRSAAQTHSMPQVEIPESTLLLLQQSESTAKLHCTVDIRAGTLQKTVDTGASVSVLPACTVEEYFEGVPLQLPAAHLATYSQTPIKVL